tara:strand:- start:683 stop:1753 length:1071 start_codon:yes stop_codon:yes gene_type:complete
LRAAKWLRCLDIGALLGNFITFLLDFCPWHTKGCSLKLHFLCIFNKKTNTQNMKKELLTMLASSALFAYSANAEIVLTEDLSAYGYIDAAYSSANDASDLAGSVAEFELGLAFTPADDPFSAVAELSFDSDTGLNDDGEISDSSAEFETVTITYAASDSVSFTAGNMLTYQGFETYDATGLYQFSYQGIDGPVYSAGYAFGSSVDYSTDAYSLGFWVGEGSGDEGSFEYFVKYTGVEGLTVVGVIADDGGYDTQNVWASYDYNAFTFAAEYTATSVDDNSGDTDAYMALVYYSMGDAGLTLRYSGGEDAGEDFDKFTVSPSYAFSDSVFGLLEYSVVDVDGKAEDTQLAAELIFSF